MTELGQRKVRTRIAAASLVLGPLLMSIGDLIHPAEDLDAAEQASIVFEHASRWYAGHLLLFIGLLVFLPGLLALASLLGERRSNAGYAARLLLLVGGLALSAVFVGEMMIGRYVLDGGSEAGAEDLLQVAQSGAMAAAMVPALLSFFIGAALVVVPLISSGGTLRWPAALLAAGFVLIIAEIVSAQVLLSQIGNVVLLAGTTGFAWRILQEEHPAITD